MSPGSTYFLHFKFLLEDDIPLTELLHKRGVLSLTLKDQGRVHKTNETPSGYPMKFWGLFGKEAPILHTRQQNFLIGPFA